MTETKTETVSETDETAETKRAPAAQVMSDSILVSGKTFLRATVSVGQEIWASTVEWKWHDLVFREDDARRRQLARDVAEHARTLTQRAISDSRWRSFKSLHEMFGEDAIVADAFMRPS